MVVRKACPQDLPFLRAHDSHIPERNTDPERILIAEADGSAAGWLRYSFFWDSIPFMDMLFILEEHRGRGYGRDLVLHWERRMGELGYSRVLTSTSSAEYAQHFYHHLGYRTIGGFLLSPEPFEIILEKSI